MLRSFYSGISGLRNHQQAMDVIGNNIANVNTIGFKGSRVTFMDTLSQTLQGGRQASAGFGGRNPSQVGLGMTVAGIDRNFGQGPLQTTGNTMDLAIQGKGFFVVGNGNSYFYTRNGVLGVDNGNNLVNSTGDLIYGWVDTNQDGVVDQKSDELGWINLDRRGDGSITNVKSSVTPPVSGPNQGDASLGTIATFNSTINDDWRIEVVDATTGTYQVVGTKTGVLSNEANGGSATSVVGQTFSNAKLGTFVLNGGTPNLASLTIDYADAQPGDGIGSQMRFEAVEYGAGGNDIKIEFVNRGKNQSLGVTVLGDAITVNLGTDSNGFVTSTREEVMAAINAGAGTLVNVTMTNEAGAVIYPYDTPPGPPDPLSDDALALGATASIFSARYLQAGSGANAGDYFLFSSTAPGGAALETLTIASDGTVLGIFENGTTEEIARIALAVIPNPEGLLTMGDGKFAESPTSGEGFPPLIPGSGGAGTLAAGFLEMSNVDLTQEFTDMIVTQRGFQANSRIITTSDEMLQDLLALKR